MSPRSQLKKLLPYRLVETARRIAYFGISYRCYVCRSWIRTLLPQGYGYPVLERLQVVGGMRKEFDVCPVCHASDRDRLLKFFLERTTLPSNDGPRRTGNRLRVLHVAPEKGISRYLMSRRDILYEAGDLSPERFTHLRNLQRLDLTCLPIADDQYHIVIANHVLEHIPDDLRAMGEIRRILAPDGIAILQVPFSLRLGETLEGKVGESETARIRRYGQSDHVRLYSRANYIDRLRRAGLAVHQFWAFEHDAETATRLRLNPLEPIFVCSADEAIACSFGRNRRMGA